MSPFGDYKDFDECVKENQDKDDPKAYCAEIKRQMEKAAGLNIIGKSADKLIIWGPANTEIRDGEGEIIKAAALDEALAQLIKRARFSVEHGDLLVGGILEKWEAPDGTTYKTEVRMPTGRDMQLFPFLKQVPTLFVVGEVWDDNHSSQVIQKEIKAGRLNSFSISGVVLKNKFECDSSGAMCANVISKLDLSAVTICQKGMNQHAKFMILSKSAKAFFKSLCPKGNDAPCNGCKVMKAIGECSKDNSHSLPGASPCEEAKKAKEVEKVSEEEVPKGDPAGEPEFVTKADFDAFKDEMAGLIKSIKKEVEFVPPKEDEEEEKERKRLEAEKKAKEEEEEEEKETITLADVEKSIANAMEKAVPALKEGITDSLLKGVQKGVSGGRPEVGALIQKEEKPLSFDEIRKEVALGNAAKMLRGG
jgi:hypothetical protein